MEAFLAAMVFCEAPLDASAAAAAFGTATPSAAKTANRCDAGKNREGVVRFWPAAPPVTEARGPGKKPADASFPGLLDCLQNVVFRID
ncbi:unnamed protein product [Urochloa decumbens]|uniref:Secreted protein n=1 Tax=Urochloa decumbens TaxID=240449 RepID=A0ABC8ZX07_9POAL